MKRLLKLILCYTLISQCFLMTVLAKPDWPSDTGIQAEGGIVVDVDSGAVLFGKNLHQTYPPASITKLLTALIVLENCQLDETVTFSNDAIFNVEVGSNNKLDIAVGDTMSVKDCLYSLLLVSCNEAANALAEHVAGSRDAFVQMMNDRIAQIGCIESRFANPSGLNDDNQYVSPYDMALIAKEAFSNEKLMEIDSTINYTLAPTTNNPDGRSITMEHRLIKATDETSPYYYPAAKAGKTGFTSIAGNTLVTYAERDGRRLISVVLKGSPAPQYFMDGRDLLEFGFTRFQNLAVSENETEYVTGDTPVVIHEVSYSPSDLKLEDSAVITLPKDTAFSDAEKSLVAELPQGAPEGAVALLQYTYNDRKIGQAYLSLKNPAAAANTQNGEAESSPAETDETVPPSSQSNGSSGGNSQNGMKWSALHLSPLLLIPLILVLLAAVITAYIVYSRKKEARELAERRERRRQRLMEDHISSDDFERLMEERHQRTGSQSFGKTENQLSREASPFIQSKYRKKDQDGQDQDQELEDMDNTFDDDDLN